LKIGIARVRRGRDINSVNTGRIETYFIPLCSWHRAHQSREIVHEIGKVVVEESAIEDGDRQGTKRERDQLYQYWSDRDIMYTIV